MASYINNDLERIIAYNQAIAGTNTIDTVYVPSNPQEGDNAPYPLLSGASPFC